MEKINHALFLSINAESGGNGLVLFIARLAAEWPVAIAVLVYGMLIIRSWRSKRHNLIRVLAATVMAMAIAYGIRHFWPQPRPFMIGIGHTLAFHEATPSFPSFHATFLFAMGLSLIRTFRIAGGMILLLGFVTAWARIYLGVHFPFDMIGAFVVAGISTIVVGWLTLMFGPDPANLHHTLP